MAHVRARMLQNLAEVDADLTDRIAAALGVEAPAPSAGGPDENAGLSPALSQIKAASTPVDGRVVAVLASDGVDAAGIATFAAAASAVNVRVAVVAPHLGLLTSQQGTPVPAAKALLTAQSVEFDAVVLAGGAGVETMRTDPLVAMFVQEAYRHLKTIAAWGEGVDALAGFGISVEAPGVLTSQTGDTAFAESVCDSLRWHRQWERAEQLALL